VFLAVAGLALIRIFVFGENDYFRAQTTLAILLLALAHMLLGSAWLTMRSRFAVAAFWLTPPVWIVLDQIVAANWLLLQRTITYGLLGRPIASGAAFPLPWTAPDALYIMRPEELFASALGLSTSVWMRWFLRPARSPYERMRLRLRNHIIVMGIRDTRFIGRTVVSTIACAFVLAVFLLMVYPGVGLVVDDPMSEDVRRWIPPVFAWVAVPYCLLLGSARSIYRLLRSHGTRFTATQPCLACGCSCKDVLTDAHGFGHCPSCGEPLHAGQWIMPACLPLTSQSAHLRRFHLLWALPCPLLIAAMIVARFAVDWSEIHVNQIAIPAGIWFSAVTILTTWRLRRFEIERIFDRQHLQCRECGHDLHKTPVSQGIGICGECGATFARLPNS
jgi:hypothetical protein